MTPSAMTRHQTTSFFDVSSSHKVGEVLLNAGPIGEALAASA